MTALACPNLPWDPHRFLQLLLGGATGRFDCSAWLGAWLAFMDSCGHVSITGRQVRLHTNEAQPDPDSPGLNWPQVDASVYAITAAMHRPVNLTLGGTWTPRMSTRTADAWITEGRALGVQIHRGTLIDLEPAVGAVDDFRGGHATGATKRDAATYWYEDPLLGIRLPVRKSSLWRAAGALDVGNGRSVGQGQAYVLAGRDTDPSHFEVRIDPAPEAFWAYRIDSHGHVIDREKAMGADQATTRRADRARAYPVDQRRMPGLPSSKVLVPLLEGRLAKTPYNLVSPAASAIHYQAVLP